MNKYRNRKTVVDGITFDSKAESERYCELKLLLRSGKIANLKLQPEYTIQESFTTTEGVKIPAIRYRADFSYTVIMKKCMTVDYSRNPIHQPMEMLTVEDVKSPVTAKNKDYRMKIKLLADKGIFVREVIR